MGTRGAVCVCIQTRTNMFVWRSTRELPHVCLTTRRLIRCTRFDGSCLRIFAAKCSTDKKLGSTDSHWIFSYRGKSPEKPKRFFWSVQGSLRGNRNPLRLFFFCQRFLLEAKENAEQQLQICTIYRPFVKLPFSSTTAEVFRFNPFGQPPAARAPAGGALCFSAVLRLASSAWMM